MHKNRCNEDDSITVAATITGKIPLEINKLKKQED